MKNRNQDSPRRRWLLTAAAVISTGATLVGAASPVHADTVVDFVACSGLTGLGGNTFQSELVCDAGVKVNGWFRRDTDTVWSSANLYVRNQPSDHGLGVCNELEAAANGGDCPGPDGGGQINELDNEPDGQVNTRELISIELPDGFEWVSFSISSLDTNGNSNPDIERARIHVDTDGVFGTTPGSVGDDGEFMDAEGTQDAEFDIIVADLAPAFASAPFIVFEPFSANGNRDNDFLVFRATVRATPRLAALGDRVWEDLNGDGIQDCTDTGADGIIGNAGDSGPECGAGVPDVGVNLFQDMGNDGTCEIDMSQMAFTDVDGFYKFENLIPGDYCVQFEIGTVASNFCETDVDGVLVNLGAPLFTLQNVAAGGVNRDSDAAPDTGMTGSVSLSAGDENLTLDGGIVCPVKLGNRVWGDDDRDGLQDLGELGISGVRVDLFDCGVDGVAGTSDDINLAQTRVTDSSGLYMFGGETGFDLQPGEYYVKFDSETYPSDFVPTLLRVGPDALDSDCRVLDGATQCAVLPGSRSVNLDRDCGLVPPPPQTCGLELDKKCRVEPPPPTPNLGKCKGKLQQFTVRWTGSPITVSGPDNNAAGGMVNTDQEVTFTGPFSQNDVFVELTGASPSRSVFHMSCSDSDFNDPSDCGSSAGNGKNNDAGFNDGWILEGFIDKEGSVLDCSPDSSSGDPSGAPFLDSCEIVALPLPSCTTTGKPDSLTWRYDGGGSVAGGCDGSTFATFVDTNGKTHKDFSCAGVVDPTLAITVVDDKGGIALVQPGDEFTLEKKASAQIQLSNAGGTQDLNFHTSCSQPLVVGLTGGALTLVAMDGMRGGNEVTYQYTVTNTGDPLTDILVTDVPLGEIGTIPTLGNGESATLTRLATIFGTTVNTGTAVGTLANDMSCSPPSASDTVTVEAVVPACDVSVTLDKVEDKKLKVKFRNNDPLGRDLFIESLELVAFPAARGFVDKVKLEKSTIYDAKKSTIAFGSGDTIGEDDWTEGDSKKRKIKPGKDGKLEISTLGKSSKEDRFELNVSFAPGCSVNVVVENQVITYSGSVSYSDGGPADGGTPPVSVNKPPVITLMGLDNVEISVGDTYEDAGANAEDEEDGDLTAYIATNNHVNTSIAGSYVVLYDVTDSNGEAAEQVTRKVKVNATVSGGPTGDQAPPSKTRGGGFFGLFEVIGLTFVVLATRRRRKWL